MHRPLACLIAVCLCIGSVHSQLVAPQAAGLPTGLPTSAGPADPVVATTSTADPAAATAATFPAAATAPTAGPAEPARTWVQRDGYVPLPKVLEEEPAAAAEAPAVAARPALPPANNFGDFTTEPPVPDPTGTNVFADPKYAPAAVRAAIEAESNPVPESVLPSGAAAAPPVGAGMDVMTAPAGPSTGALGGSTPVTAPASNDVFSNSGGGFSNRYTPSVGNAIGSSDIIAKMIIDAPEQQVAASGDMLRAMLSNITSTPADRIFVYQTRTITTATGQPSLDLSLLFKNTGDVDRARQQNVLLSTDVMRGFIANVAARTGLKIIPGTVKTSSAVNDGGLLGAGATGASMMPGQLPGMMVPGFGMNGTYPGMAAAPQPAAQAPTNAAGRAAVNMVAVPVLLLVALAVL